MTTGPIGGQRDIGQRSGLAGAQRLGGVDVEAAGIAHSARAAGESDVDHGDRPAGLEPVPKRVDIDVLRHPCPSSRAGYESTRPRPVDSPSSAEAAGGFDAGIVKKKVVPRPTVALHPDPSAVCLDDPLRDWEPEAGAESTGSRRRLPEPVEDVRHGRPGAMPAPVSATENITSSILHRRPAR